MRIIEIPQEKTRLPVHCYLCHDEVRCTYHIPFNDSPLCDDCLTKVRKYKSQYWLDKIKMKVLRHKYYLRRKFHDVRKQD